MAYYEGLNRASLDRASGGKGAQPSVPNPDAVLQAIAAYDNDVEPDLTPQLRTWLFERDVDFISAYATEAAQVKASPPRSLWHQAEAAYMTWLIARIPTLTQPEAYHFNLIARFTTANDVAYFPGLDHFVFGAAIVDLWIKNGHSNKDDAAYRDTICFPVYEQGWLIPNCGDDHGGWWYRDALATDEGASRLAGALRARNDGDLARNAALQLVARSPRSLAVIAALEPADVWRDAVIAMGRARIHEWQKDELTPYLQRAWKAYPERHGIILYALAESSGAVVDPVQEAKGTVDWVHFAHDFGSGITKDDFVAFLDEAPRAIELSRWLMRARTKGWSVANEILPRVEAYEALPADEWAPRGPGLVALVDYLTAFEPAEAAKLTKHRTRQ